MSGTTRQPASADDRTGPGPEGQQRAFPPIRWPHPDRGAWAIMAVWLVGLIVAVFVPALIVPPAADAPSVSAVLLAFSFTLLGALIMLLAGFGFWRKYHDASAATFGAVPAIAVTAGGIILMATKLTGL